MSRAKKLSLKWSAVSPNESTEPSKQPAGPLQVPGADGEFTASEKATMGLPQVAVGEASDDPTAYLNEGALRPETDEDLAHLDEGPIPMFAESTMSLDERTLALQAVEAGVVGGATPSEGPTVPLNSVETSDEEVEKTEAIDPETIGRSPAENGATAPMQAVDGSASPQGGRASDGAVKTQKTQAISAPRQPFARTDKSGADGSEATSKPSEQEAAASPEVQSSTDGVQMFDAAELRRMREELEQQDNGDD